jgi:hypothetical protein
MVKGKLEGAVVAVDADGKTYHGTFVHGRRTADWAEGPPTEKAKKAATPAPPKSPAKATPSPVAKQTPAPRPAATPEPTETPRESSALDSLTRPPSSLRANPEPRPADEAPSTTPAPAPAGPTLTTGEAIDLADTHAKSKGIDLHTYRRPQAQYIAADDAWSVFYDQRTENGNAEAGKHFTVQVEDKTKKVTVIPGR